MGTRGAAPALALGLGVLALPAPAEPDAPRRGAEIYATICASCHGSDGRGEPGSRMFGIEMPDFSDCAFATREPDADWIAIVHQGGPVRAFSPLMPALGALTPEDIRAAVAQLRSFCSEPCWPRGELNLPRPLFTEKAYPEDEAVITTQVNTDHEGFVGNELLFEKRVGRRGQLEIVLPILARERVSAGDWVAGVGDLALAAKYALFADYELGTIASLGGEVKLPTGDSDRGLGAGTTVFEPYLAAGQILPGGAFLQLQALGEIPSNGRLDSEMQLRGVVGASFELPRFGRTWSPMVEGIGTWVFGDRTQASFDLVPQLEVTLSTRQHVMLDAGVRVPVTRTRGRPTSFVIHLLWDWYDGGLFEGW